VIERHDRRDFVVGSDRPVARLSAIDPSHDRLAELVAMGVVRPPSTPERYLPKRRIKAKGSVSELVAEQRR
jgi:antitoxin (DNA-binding transcriptional repressor) of toxin-antitoxin stability system